MTQNLHAVSKGIRSLIVIVALVSAQKVWGQDQTHEALNVFTYKFTTEHGLSQNNVYCVTKDQNGFIWIGTGDGLNRFDGYTFTHFSHSDDDPGSLSNDVVRKLLIDSKGRLWVGTYDGLNLYDHEKESFQKFLHDPSDDNSISQNTISFLMEDSNHHLWVATYWGLNKIDLETFQVTRFYYHADGTGLADNAVNSLLEDRTGRIWACTNRGISIIGRTGVEKNINQSGSPGGLPTAHVVDIVQDPRGPIYLGSNGGGLLRLKDENDSTFTYVRYDPQSASIGSNVISTVAFDRTGNLLVGTDGAGLFQMSSNGRFRRIHDSRNNTLAKGSVQRIFIDDQNNYWFGLFGAGLVLIPGEPPPFEHYQFFDAEMERRGKNSILALVEDHQKKIWIGTDGSGLYRFDPETKHFSSFRHDPSARNSLSTDVVKSLLVDDRNNLYIGTYAGGLNYLDTRSKTFSHFLHDPLDNTSISTNHVWSLLQDRSKRIFVGQLGGLDEFFPEKKKFKPLSIPPSYPVTANTATVFSMVEDRNGIIWMGTRLAGIHRFDPASDSFQSFLNSSKGDQNFPSNEILTLAVDAAGRLLVGTDNKGLIRLDPESLNVSNLIPAFREKNVPSVLEDESNIIWFTSFDGLHKFDPATGATHNYNAADGLQGIQFNEGACLRSSTGDYYFGGTNGLNIFRPGHIKEDHSKPRVTFTKLSLFHDIVQINDDSGILTKSIANTETITFQPNQNVFSIEFACLEYKFPKKNKYRYFLEGFDRHWNDIKENRTATYTNLRPGEYLLKVSATNNSGIWNDNAASIKIVIVPRWYQLLSVRIGAAVLMALLITGIVYARTNFLIRQKKKLEYLVEVRTRLVESQKEEIRDKNEKLEQAYEEVNAVNEELQKANTNLEQVVENRTKELRLTIKKLIETDEGLNTFLYRSSHDLRGPISSLLGLSRLARIQNRQDELNPYFSNIEKTASGMLRLLKRLTDTAALFRVNRNSRRIRVDDFIQSLSNQLKAINAGNSVRVEFENRLGKEVICDPVLLGHVVINLMENGILFHGDNDPFVKCIFQYRNQNLIIQVIDNGTGIPPQIRDKIFDMFYRGSEKSTGNGLGLFIVKKALEILEGSIDITSEPGKITTVTVIIPLH